MRNLRERIPYPPVFTRSGLRMSFLRNKDVIAPLNQPETFLGDGNYELAEDVNEEAMGERVSILHKTCGNVRKTRLMETL